MWRKAGRGVVCTGECRPGCGCERADELAPSSGSPAPFSALLPAHLHHLAAKSEKCVIAT